MKGGTSFILRTPVSAFWIFNLAAPDAVGPRGARDVGALLPCGGPTCCARGGQVTAVAHVQVMFAPCSSQCDFSRLVVTSQGALSLLTH